jgi:hypothetical protein
MIQSAANAIRFYWSWHHGRPRLIALGVRRRWVIGFALQWLVAPSAGCLPFFGGKGPPPRTPAAVERFAASASALGLPPSPPSLAEATRLLAGAVESLPNAPGAREGGKEIGAQAQAMQRDAADESGRARRSISLALQALRQMRKPPGSKRDRERALEDAQQALGVEDGYRAVARALVLFTGGRPGLLAGSSLAVLVARFSVEDDDMARRTGAQALRAVSEALRALHVDSGDLGRRAERLGSAAPLEYAPALRDALERAVGALRTYKANAAAFASLEAQAHDAVERIARDRPFELQRPAAQDALRLIADALTVASRSAAGDR